MTDWRNEVEEDGYFLTPERRERYRDLMARAGISDVLPPQTTLEKYERYKDGMKRLGYLNIPSPPADNEDMETFSVELHPTQANVAYVKLGNLQGLVRYDNLVYAVGILALHRMKRLDGLVETGLAQAD